LFKRAKSKRKGFTSPHKSSKLYCVLYLSIHNFFKIFLIHRSPELILLRHLEHAQRGDLFLLLVPNIAYEFTISISPQAH